jgi:hypothetical protein
MMMPNVLAQKDIWGKLSYKRAFALCELQISRKDVTVGQNVVLTSFTASAVCEYEEKHVLKWIIHTPSKRGPS